MVSDSIQPLVYVMRGVGRFSINARTDLGAQVRGPVVEDAHGADDVAGGDVTLPCWRMVW